MNYKIKRFFRNFAIENLMTYIAASMAIIFVGDLMTDYMISGYLYFDRAAILNGEIWRIVTFLLLPRTDNLIFIVFSVWFYYSMGQHVESAWGSHNLTVYFLTGYALLLIVGFATGYTSTQALYFSLFLVYASFYPHNQFRLFFLVAVEARWLAIADAILMGLEFFQAFPLYLMPPFRILALGMQLSVLAGFAVYAIFFGKPFVQRFMNRFKHREFIHEMRRQKIKVTKHEEDDE